jgi:hypothetical protein
MFIPLIGNNPWGIDFSFTVAMPAAENARLKVGFDPNEQFTKKRWSFPKV